MAEAERKLGNLAQSFYAAQAARQARDNIRDITNLAGDYDSAAQLESEYAQRIQQLDYELQNQEQARRPSSRRRRSSISATKTRESRRRGNYRRHDFRR